MELTKPFAQVLTTGHSQEQIDQAEALDLRQLEEARNARQALSEGPVHNSGPPEPMEPRVLTEPPRYARFPARGLFGDPPFYSMPEPVIRQPLTPLGYARSTTYLPTPSTATIKWPGPPEGLLRKSTPLYRPSHFIEDSSPIAPASVSVSPDLTIQLEASKRLTTPLPKNDPSTPIISEAPQPPDKQEPSPPPTKPSKSLPIRPVSTRTRQTVTVQFSDVAAHTAKCDQCDKRNKDGMTRCLACGWQCCRRCLVDRGGDRTHRSFTSTHAPESETRTPVPASSTTNASGGTTRATIPSVEKTSGTTEARQAAEALWSLGSGGSGSQSMEQRSTTRTREHQNDRDAETLSDLESEDPDETLTMGSESEVENDMDAHEIVDYREVRRNPPRVARPTQLTE